MKKTIAVVNSKKCIGCGQCTGICPVEAIQLKEVSK
jgi:Fe-S-cluster-containing hydrogenase component 2